MAKRHNKLTALLSLSCLSFVLSCDFRTKEEIVGTDIDNTCVITWQNADGSILDQEIYEKGKLPEYKGEEPINESSTTYSYKFIGWEPEITEVEKSATYTATYEAIESPDVYRLNPDGKSYRLVKWDWQKSRNQNRIDVPSEHSGKPVTVIDNYAFRGLSWIKIITIPSTITEICDFAFQNTGITSINIPNSVKTFGTNVFKDCKKLTTISLPNELAQIPERFFYNCDSLVNFRIPDSVVNISAKAFYNCDYLSSIELSNSVVNIDSKAFYQCEKLSNVTINVDNSNLRQVGEYAFSETGITNLTLPKELNNVASYAFANCNNLEHFYISNNNENNVSIKSSAFEGCRNLKSFSAPTSVSTFEKAAFKDCTSLTSFTLGSETEEIADSLFQNCTSLGSLSFSNPNALLKIGKKALSNTSITSIEIPKNVSLVDDEAFSNCSLLKNVVFPSEFSIQRNVFANCPKLTSFYLPSTTVDISKSFVASSIINSSSQKSAITNVSLPNNAFSITSDAFNEYTSLQYNTYTEAGETGYVGKYLGNSSNPYVALIKASITSANTTFKLHPSCTIVADNAFSSCTTDYNVEIDTSIRNLGNSTFANSSIKSITFTENASLSKFNPRLFENCSSLNNIAFPKNINDIDSTAFNGCVYLTSFSQISSDNSLYEVVDNGLLVRDETVICGVKNYDFSQADNPTIFNDIKTIGPNAFYRRYNKTELRLPGSIEKVCTNAYFMSNNSTTPNTFEFGFDTYTRIKTIEQNAFGSLNQTTDRTIKFNNRLENWLSINSVVTSDGSGTSLPVSIGGTTTFYYADGLHLGYIELPQNLDLKEQTEIPDFAFCGNKKIENISLGSQLKKIGNYSFYKCTNLNRITFERAMGELVSLETIGTSSFEECTSFTGFKLITDGIESSANFLGLFKLSTISSRAFYNCQQLSSKLYIPNLTSLGANALYNTTNLADQSLILRISKNKNYGDSKDISFAGANKLNSIIVFFANVNYSLTIDSGTFDKNVKLYCCWSYENADYSTNIGNPPNNKISDYHITNKDSRATIFYRHTYSLEQDDDYNAVQNWFTVDNYINITEGKPEPPVEPEPGDDTGTGSN